MNLNADIKKAKTASRIKQLMSKYEMALLNSSSTNLTTEQCIELRDGRERLQDRLSGIVAKTYLEKAAAISELSVFIYDNLHTATNTTSPAPTPEAIAATTTKTNMYAQLDTFRAVARRWNEITLHIPDMSTHGITNTNTIKDSDDDSDDSDEDSDEEDDNDYTMYTDHWAMSFAFDKEDGNAQIKTFEFDPSSADCKRVQSLLAKHVAARHWQTFQEEVGMLVVMQRILDTANDGGGGGDGSSSSNSSSSSSSSNNNSNNNSSSSSNDANGANGTSNRGDYKPTKPEFEKYCQNNADTTIVERSTVDEATYLHAKTNAGTISSTHMFRNIMMQRSPLHNMPIAVRSHGNQIKYHLRRPRQDIAKVHLVPPVATQAPKISINATVTNYPADRHTLWRACYASYTSYRTEHDKLTMDAHRGDAFSFASSQTTSLFNATNAATTTSINATSEVVDGNVSIEPTMHHMHVLCRKMLASGSEVVVFPSATASSTSSIHHHRMIFECEEDEGLQLMSLATSSEAKDQGNPDSNDRETLRRQQQRLAVDSSELVLQWYQQHVQSTSTQDLSMESLLTAANAQHMLGLCAQSISLGNGLCPYYMMDQEDGTDEALDRHDVQKVLCVVWRVSTVSFNTFVFSAERVTKTSSTHAGGGDGGGDDAGDTSTAMFNSVTVTVEGAAVTYMDGEDETSQQQFVGAPLPVVLSKYINAWSKIHSQGNDTKKRGRSNSSTSCKKSKKKAK